MEKHSADGGEGGAARVKQLGIIGEGIEGELGKGTVVAAGGCMGIPKGRIVGAFSASDNSESTARQVVRKASRNWCRAGVGCYRRFGFDKATP